MVETITGTVEVVSLLVSLWEKPVFNLTVEKYETYFIGVEKSWVHNCDLNKINHVFGFERTKRGYIPIQKHRLGGFLNKFKGQKAEAFNALQDAGQALADTGKLITNPKGTKGVLTEHANKVNVKGDSVHIGGRIVDGVFNLRTAYIKKD